MLIGEVARRSGVSARMLRHYDALGLVRPTDRTGGGYREYAAEDVARLLHVESLRSLGLSLQDVGRALDEPGFAPSGVLTDLIRRTRERIAGETELLTRLCRIDAAGPAGWDDVLHVVALLRALRSPDPDRRQRAALDAAEAPVEALVEAVLREADPVVAGALRWALARSTADACAPLARGLAAADPAVRVRAVLALAELPGGAATSALRDALRDPDLAVRRRSALALGARGVPSAIPVLVDMVADAANDVDAADALSALAARPAAARRIAAALAARLAPTPAGTPQPPAVRRRLTQALADIPGPDATAALDRLSGDEDPGVALTAAYILRLRAQG
ncbi:HEAT repeat domain-containing protein [Streptomyces sp. NPDC060194]|uniref:HEAT repeat domain-containing protein n=1 Tax=Streptomyces sp. NPDC060194 TaxID=3347069 RepID=UPI0036493733